MPFNPSSYQDILGQLAGTDYSLGGVNSAKDVRKRFGLSADVGSSLRGGGVCGFYFRQRKRK